MAKEYLVTKNGLERTMTESSYKLAGEKRGWKIVSEVKPKQSGNSSVRDEMERLKAEKAAKEQIALDESSEPEIEVVKGKPGRKPKQKQDEE